MLDEGMSAQGELEKLASLLRYLAEYQPDAQPTWSRAQAILHRLNAEAVRLRLPFGYVRQKTTSLAGHVAALLGVSRGTGHSRDELLCWAMSDLAALRSAHGFGPVLSGTAADNPLVTVH